MTHERNYEACGCRVARKALRRAGERLGAAVNPVARHPRRQTAREAAAGDQSRIRTLSGGRISPIAVSARPEPNHPWVGDLSHFAGVSASGTSPS